MGEKQEHGQFLRCMLQLGYENQPRLDNWVDALSVYINRESLSYRDKIIEF